MAYAVIDSDGSVRCAVGSDSEDISASTASNIDLEDNTASTILDVPPAPDFGQCATWAAITLGSSTSCNPAVIPIFITGVVNVQWDYFPANGDEDIAICAIGGVLLIEDAGTEIEIS